MSFRQKDGDFRTQFDEADRLMYQEKKRYYAVNGDEWAYVTASRRRQFASDLFFSDLALQQ